MKKILSMTAVAVGAIGISAGTAQAYPADSYPPAYPADTTVPATETTTAYPPTDTGEGTGTDTGKKPGALPNTGLPVVGISVTAAGLVLLGATMVSAARRRDLI